MTRLLRNALNKGHYYEVISMFLLIVPGNRASGMGEAFVAIADDDSATWRNPAGLGYLDNFEILNTYTNWYPDFNYPYDYYFTTVAFFTDLFVPSVKPRK